MHNRCIDTRKINLVHDHCDWLEIMFSDIRPQGWKLHVSATIFNARTILKKILPVLLEQKISFKIISDEKNLLLLNSGEVASQQAGKFITIYPNNDDVSVKLGVELDNICHNFFSPEIVTI